MIKYPQYLKTNCLFILVTECTQKWSNIREYYKKAINNDKKSTGSTATSSKNSNRMEQLSFLDGFTFVKRK